MKVLVVGSGGREHTLAWKIAQDSSSPQLFCAPGNAGMAALGTVVDIGAEDVDGLTAWAREHRPDLTVIGPEVPLCAGLADALIGLGLRVFGPTRDAAQIEGSKIFAKEVMMAAGVPTAASADFTDSDAAIAYVHEQGAPIVVKADGLAAGKGVTVCSDVAQAEQAIHAALDEGAFGASGAHVLIEECLTGQEASILGLVDGERTVLLASSQDHKRAFDGDRGPNTGGMGAYSPAPLVDASLWPRIHRDVFEPTLAELKRRGIEYRGVLYAGLMIDGDTMKVLEFNCRFGDPETQVVIPRMAGDLLPVLIACADGALSEDMIQWRDEACVCVVMASGGYPGSYAKGHVIEGLDRIPEDAVVFHAGTTLSDGQVVTSGGRVLGVTALGSDLEKAVASAYEAVGKISFQDAFYRTDIAARALSV